MTYCVLAMRGSVAVASLLICQAGRSEEAGSELAAAEATVRRVDAEWAVGAGTAGVDAWMAHYGADAIVMLPNDPLVNGKELVRRSALRFLSAPQFSVAWHAVKVEVARSGELAYLAAVYELRFADARGALKSDRGRREEIWRKQTDGSWKCIIDTWDSGAPAAATPNVAAAQPAPDVVPRTEPSPALRSAPAAPLGVADSKYGAMPIRYEESIRQYFQDHLKDPDSVRYQEITQPEKGFTKGVSGTLLLSETRNYGWTVKATINARNSGGSYGGFKTYTFLFRGEKMVHVLAPLPGDESIDPRGGQ